MKRNIKKMLATVLVCIMVCGTGLIAHAQIHECAFSYMGTSQISNMQVSSHTYLEYNSITGKSEKKTCNVYVQRYADIWKCACGATEQRNLRSNVIHTGCGQ